MSKTFAIPIEKCISIKENVFNNNQYKAVSITSKNYDNVEIIESVVEQDNTIYNITADFDDAKTPVIESYENNLSGSIFEIKIKKDTYNGQTIYRPTTGLEFADYVQKYIDFKGETSYLGFDINDIYFQFSANSNVNVIRNPDPVSQQGETPHFTYKNAIKSANTISDTNYRITEKGINEGIGREYVPYFHISTTPTRQYDYINANNVYNGDVTNGVLGNTKHEMFIQYQIDATNCKVNYYICMLLNETRNWTDTGTQTARYETSYRTNVAFKFEIVNVFKQWDDYITKRGDGANSDYDLPSNNLINDWSNIKYKNQYGDVTQKPSTYYGLDKTLEFYADGKPTVEITLPIMPLQDLDGNVVVLPETVNPANIVVGDKFKITKNGTWDNLKLYQVTTVETCFNGAFRWVIKAKETYELLDLNYFVPQLKYNRANPSYSLANVADFEKIMAKDSFGYDDYSIGVVVKRHHRKKSNWETGYTHGKLFGASYGVSFGYINFNYTKDGVTIDRSYDISFTSTYKITNLYNVFHAGNLVPPSKWYRRSETNLKYNLVGICIKQGTNVSKKSKNFIAIDSDGNFDTQPIEKLEKVKW